MYEPHVTLLATVVAPPRHIVTESGVPLLTMRLASTPRWYDRSQGQWRDGETLVLNVTCWRTLADNVAASIRTGMPVVVSGRLRMRAWADQSGARRSALEVEAFSVGPDLSRGVATF
ncbi:MAG: single-stranded DNA-binding protein, partial [Streptosporangiales bacterium]|nr:single-stranded DNA-binding protein [Streptosporangiales bacterium]